MVMLYVYNKKLPKHFFSEILAKYLSEIKPRWTELNWKWNGSNVPDEVLSTQQPSYSTV